MHLLSFVCYLLSFDCLNTPRNEIKKVIRFLRSENTPRNKILATALRVRLNDDDSIDILKIGRGGLCVCSPIC